MSEKRLVCIRGAVCTENTIESVTENVGNLYTKIHQENQLAAQDIVSIQFTITPDLTALNPATALRKADKTGECAAIPLFCAAEPVIQNMKPKVIRIMITAYKECGFIPTAVYLNGAQTLRPDLTSEAGNR